MDLLSHPEILRARASGDFTAMQTGRNYDPVWRTSMAKTTKSGWFGSHWPSLGSTPLPIS